MWVLCRVYWGPPCFQGDITHNARRLPALGASLVYNFLLVVTILPKYVSGCWTRVMMSYTSTKAPFPKLFYSEKKPCILALLSALAVLKPYMCVSFSSCAAASVNELLIVILGSQRMVILDNAESILLLPLTSQRGGHCLLHTGITFPYQLPVEMKCLMFACCGKVAAVNQECSESCSNLFFISRSFE